MLMEEVEVTLVVRIQCNLDADIHQAYNKYLLLRVYSRLLQETIIEISPTGKVGHKPNFFQAVG